MSSNLLTFSNFNPKFSGGLGVTYSLRFFRHLDLVLVVEVDVLDRLVDICLDTDAHKIGDVHFTVCEEDALKQSLTDLIGCGIAGGADEELFPWGGRQSAADQATNGRRLARTRRSRVHCKKKKDLLTLAQEQIPAPPRRRDGDGLRIVELVCGERRKTVQWWVVDDMDSGVQ